MGAAKQPKANPTSYGGQTMGAQICPELFFVGLERSQVGRVMMVMAVLLGARLE